MNDMEELIVKHLIETTGRKWPVETIHAQPNYKKVWAYWKALAYYQIRHHYERIEDVPDGIKWITVMGDISKEYAWREGEYVFVQETTFKTCKSVYGD